MTVRPHSALEAVYPRYTARPLGRTPEVCIDITATARQSIWERPADDSRIEVAAPLRSYRVPRRARWFRN